MTRRLIAGATFLALGLTLAVDARAQGLQPGMRTMLQQGGIEPGPLLGAILPGEGYAPDFGFAPSDRYRADPADPRWSHQGRTSRYDRRETRGGPFGHGRRRYLAQWNRHHFAR